MQTSAFEYEDIGPLRLRAGQAVQATVRRGTVVQVLAGSVRVCEPSRWLAERMISPASTLREGEAMQIDGGGWIEVLAQGCQAQVLVMEPVPVWSTYWRLAISAARRVRLSLGHISEAL